jgi:hypothetical protein
MTAVAHVTQVRTERSIYRANTNHYSDTTRFICREPVRECSGLTCSSCDALVDTDGVCRCSA